MGCLHDSWKGWGEGWEEGGGEGGGGEEVARGRGKAGGRGGLRGWEGGTHGGAPGDAGWEGGAGLPESWRLTPWKNPFGWKNPPARMSDLLGTRLLVVIGIELVQEIMFENISFHRIVVV